MRQLPERGRAARRCVLLAATAALALTPTATSAATAEPRPSAAGSSTPSGAGDYLSRPDIDAPALHTTGTAPPGLLFVTPHAPSEVGAKAAIYEDGELVWWSDPGTGRRHSDLEPITYQGEPALVLWEGNLVQVDDEESEYVVLDRSYQEIASFAVHGLPTDSHDIEFSPDGSHVLLMSYERVPYDLSPWGGPEDATVIDVVVQEQEVATGEITFEWSALDHIPADETLGELDEPDPSGFYDLFHLNSLEYDTDGNLLFSARSTSTVYRVDHDTGEILWRFGGENSDFTFADPTDMPSGQHDARRLPDGRLSVFDNGNQRDPQVSRGAVYELNEETMTAELVEELLPEDPVHAPITGSNRQEANGDQLVSFGNTGVLTGFDDGEQVFTAEFEDDFITYRAELADWHAQPTTQPDAALGETAEDGTQTMYMSWNGATDVAAWLVEAGPDEDRLGTVAIVPKTGFETAAGFIAPHDAEVFRVTPLGPFGEPLGSRTITP